jgi:NAD(P)H-dependent flavin oxidoreductase YrpB (nitropropane dioxygenase family)
MTGESKKMLKTRITTLFGIEYPIIQGAMQWLSRAEMVAAVANAGGLGIISSLTFPTAVELRAEIRKTKQLTQKPFAVNITMLPTMRPVDYEQYLEVSLEEGVKIIETAGRSPEAFMGKLKDAGVKVMHKVARVRDARSAERIGVDAVTIVGFEAGGHPGMDNVAAMVLIPIAVDAVKIPVIAGGGIADGRGLVAALSLGAEAVLMGTRFMVSKESGVHPDVLRWLCQAGETDTMIIERSIKNAARVARTELAQQVLEMEERGATLEELLPVISGLRGRKAFQGGDVNAGVFCCGQAVGLIHDQSTVKEIIDSIVSEAGQVGQRLHQTGIV